MKKQKGMTLIEIIVALFLYAMLALLLVEIMSVVNTTMMSTNQLNRRLSFEGKLADNQIVRNSLPDQTTGTPFNVRIRYGTTDTNGNWTNLVGSFGDITRGDDAISYNAWVTQYHDPDMEGLHDYSENINYRFMTFTNETLTPDHLEDYAFNVHIMLVPFLPTRDGIDVSTAEGLANARALQEKAYNFIDEITSIEVNGQIVDLNEPHGVDDGVRVYPASELPHVVNAHPNENLVQMLNDDGTLRNATEYIDFAILNLADDATIAGRNQVSNDPDETDRGYDVTVTFKAGDENRLTITLPAVYMYVLRGDTKSYYEQTLVVLDLSKFDSRDATVREQAIVACRSKAGDENYTSADYDVLPS